MIGVPVCKGPSHLQEAKIWALVSTWTLVAMVIPAQPGARLTKYR